MIVLTETQIVLISLLFKTIDPFQCFKSLAFVLTKKKVHLVYSSILFLVVVKIQQMLQGMFQLFVFFPCFNLFFNFPHSSGRTKIGVNFNEQIFGKITIFFPTIFE